MESFFALLLTALQDKITTDVPDIKWVDQDLGQLEHYEIRPAVAFPCVLIDFGQTTYDQESKESQWGNVSIELRLAFPPFSASNNVAPFSVKENALKFWEIENLLYQALQDWDPPGDICQPLTRVRASSEKREDAIRVRSILFTTTFEDDGASPVYTQANRPTLEIDF